MKTPCPKMADLTAYALGELARERAETVRAHLETCEACRAEAAAQTAMRDEIRSALLADTQTPAALSPERLAAVLATPPSTAGTPCATSFPWRKVVFAAKVAACLVLFFGILSAALFPATGHSVKKAKAQAARARGLTADWEANYYSVVSEPDASVPLSETVAASPPPAALVAAEVPSKDVVRRKTDASAGRNMIIGASGALSESPRLGQPERADADGRSLAESQKSETEFVPLRIEYPKPQFTGTPREIKNAPNLESPEDVAKRMGARPQAVARGGEAPASPGLARSEKPKEDAGAIAHGVRGETLNFARMPSEESTVRRSRMLGEANVVGNETFVTYSAAGKSGNEQSDAYVHAWAENEMIGVAEKAKRPSYTFIERLSKSGAGSAGLKTEAHEPSEDLQDIKVDVVFADEEQDKQLVAELGQLNEFRRKSFDEHGIKSLETARGLMKDGDYDAAREHYQQALDFIIRRPANEEAINEATLGLAKADKASAPAPMDGGQYLVIDLGDWQNPPLEAQVISAMTARNMSLHDALRLVCEGTGTEAHIKEGVVMITPLGASEVRGDTKAASQATAKKLREIMVPEVTFRPPATLVDAVDFFNLASREYDNPEIPVDQRGVRFILMPDVQPDIPPAPPVKKPPVQVNVNPFVKTAVEPLSTFAIGTDTASYTLTRQSLGNGMLPDPAVVRVEEFVNALDYKDTAPERTTFRIIAEGAPSPFGRNTQLVRLAIKGKRLGREEQRPANLVFLVDASGSMAQPDRMGAIQLALGQLLQGLRPEDRLQIVTFNEKARLVQPLVSAANRQEIMANFKRVQATGPTSLQDGMVMAYQQAVATFQPGAENRVILITDGIANLGSSEASDILAEIDACRRQGIRLSVFGVGRGTYNDALLQQLANKGDGSYRFLDSPEAITDAFVNDLSATLYTIASDAKVQVEWFPHAVAEYRQLGYEARALTAEQFRDDTVVAGQIGSGQTASALYEISLARTRALPPNAELGIVRIRFRPSDGGAVQEISRPILKSDLAESFAKARPEFQFAAVASGFAERLRHSPYAPTQGYTDLANLIRPAAQQLYLDTRFAELVRLLDAAAAVTR